MSIASTHPANRSVAKKQQRPTGYTPDQVAVMPQADAVAACMAIVRYALDDLKAQNVTEIDVSVNSQFADRMVIASGTSTRHVKALADNVSVEGKLAGFIPLGIEGERDAEWILVDFGMVVVHLMLPTARTFYDIEGMWAKREVMATPNSI